MAEDIEAAAPISERSRKRKRVDQISKLLPNEKVEVRSIEEGYQGSWHCATILETKKRNYVVKYEHMTREDGSGNLVESVPISFGVNGKFPSKIHSNRGKIRPVPPRFTSNMNCLHYGQCVDVFHDESWWEGVVFDHEDGCDKRSIFFPDVGDEIRVSIENVRFTRDWNAANDKWNLRGNWVFLEVLEELELESEWPILVSVKQIWYELRMKKRFLNEMKEWICNGREIWKETIKEVITDNVKLTMVEFFTRLQQEDHQILEITNVLDPTMTDTLNIDFDGTFTPMWENVADSPIINVPATKFKVKLKYGGFFRVARNSCKKIYCFGSQKCLHIDTWSYNLSHLKEEIIKRYSSKNDPGLSIIYVDKCAPEQSFIEFDFDEKFMVILHTYKEENEVTVYVTAENNLNSNNLSLSKQVHTNIDEPHGEDDSDICPSEESYYSHISWDNQAEVKWKGNRWEVNLQDRTCSCRVWQVKGLPCIHATTFIAFIKDADWDKYVDPYFTIEKFKETYAFEIAPLPGKDQWMQKDGEKIHPPIIKRPPGRPRKNRIRASNETKRRHKCPRCGQYGHREKTCKNPASQDLDPTETSTSKRGRGKKGQSRHNTGKTTL